MSGKAASVYDLALYRKCLLSSESKPIVSGYTGRIMDNLLGAS